MEQALLYRPSGIADRGRASTSDARHRVLPHDASGEKQRDWHFLLCFKLTADNRTVYEAKYLEIGGYDEPMLVSVTRLEEGAWLHHFRALVDERKQAGTGHRKEMGLDEDLHDLTDDEFYACSPTLAETLESRCGYAKGPLFPEGCPLRGSAHVLNFADGPSREWMCDYHWAVFSGTVENFSRNETSVAAPTSPKVKQVSRPRRCFAANRLACQGRSSAGDTSSTGTKARASTNVRRSESSAPLTKFSVQATFPPYGLYKMAAGQPPVGQPFFRHLNYKLTVVHFRATSN